MARLSHEQSLSLRLVPELRRSPQSPQLAFSFRSDGSPVFLASAFFILAEVGKSLI